MYFYNNLSFLRINIIYLYLNYNYLTFANLLKIIVLSLIIILLAYITTHWISLKCKNFDFSRNIKIVEKLPLGVDKQFLLIQFQNNYYLIYISKNGAQVIDKINSLEIKDKDINPNYKNKYNKFFDIFKQKYN